MNSIDILEFKKNLYKQENIINLPLSFVNFFCYVSKNNTDCFNYINYYNLTDVEFKNILSGKKIFNKVSFFSSLYIQSLHITNNLNKKQFFERSCDLFLKIHDNDNDAKNKFFTAFLFCPFFNEIEPYFFDFIEKNNFQKEFTIISYENYFKLNFLNKYLEKLDNNDFLKSIYEKFNNNNLYYELYDKKEIKNQKIDFSKLKDIINKNDKLNTLKNYINKYNIEYENDVFYLDYSNYPLSFLLNIGSGIYFLNSFYLKEREQVEEIIYKSFYENIIDAIEISKEKTLFGTFTKKNLTLLKHQKKYYYDNHVSKIMYKDTFFNRLNDSLKLIDLVYDNNKKSKKAKFSYILDLVSQQNTRYSIYTKETNSKEHFEKNILSTFHLLKNLNIGENKLTKLKKVLLENIQKNCLTTEFIEKMYLDTLLHKTLITNNIKKNKI